MSNQKTLSHYSLVGKWRFLLFGFSFFMAFPSLLFLGQNVSVFIFLMIIFFLARHVKNSLFSFNKPIQWISVFFAFGAILSVLNIPLEAGVGALDRALLVLPNYLYWCILMILLVTHRRLIHLKVVYRGIFWGLLTTISYYLIFQQFLQGFPVFNLLTPNTFAFILICYTPIAVFYLKEQKGRFWATMLLFFLVWVLLQDGRRAGMVLVFLGGMMVLYVDQLTWKRMMGLAIVIPLFFALIYTSPIESFVFQSSERIHEMIYKTSKIRTEDRSYLTRVVQIKKGLAIFESYPYTGVGLNNFSRFETDFDKSFEGAKYVIDKKDIGKKSAHNSYIGLLAEGGIFLLIPFLLILIFNIFFFVLNFNYLNARLPVYVGFVAMAVHLYFISDIVNVYAWFLIGLTSALSFRS